MKVSRKKNGTVSKAPLVESIVTVVSSNTASESGNITVTTQSPPKVTTMTTTTNIPMLLVRESGGGGKTIPLPSIAPVDKDTAAVVEKTNGLEELEGILDGELPIDFPNEIEETMVAMGVVVDSSNSTTTTTMSPSIRLRTGALYHHLHHHHHHHYHQCLKKRRRSSTNASIRICECSMAIRVIEMLKRHPNRLEYR